MNWNYEYKSMYLFVCVLIKINVDKNNLLEYRKCNILFKIVLEIVLIN